MQMVELDSFIGEVDELKKESTIITQAADVNTHEREQAMRYRQPVSVSTFEREQAMGYRQPVGVSTFEREQTTHGTASDSRKVERIVSEML